MNKRLHSSKGFTLVEIMIVVVIIGLLAAMAIPAFQKVRTNSLGKTMVNDARQIAGACQQMLLSYPDIPSSSITLAYNKTTGVLNSTAAGSMGADEIQKYVSKISKAYTFTAITYNGVQVANAVAFTMSHAQLAPGDVSSSQTGNQNAAISFDTEGKVL